MRNCGGSREGGMGLWCHRSAHEHPGLWRARVTSPNCPARLGRDTSHLTKSLPDQGVFLLSDMELLSHGATDDDEDEESA